MNDYDAIFSTVKFYQGPAASPCHKAIAITTSRFAAGFPGWPIYRRLVRGDNLLDRDIEAYFIGLARSLSRAVTTRDRRKYISSCARNNVWIAQAGRDAMDFVLFGRYAEGLHERAGRFGVANKTYQKIRDPIALGVRFGVDRWISELHYNFTEILSRQKYPIQKLAVEL